MEVCKEKSITIKVNVQEKILGSRLKLDLNSQNTMLKKKVFSNKYFDDNFDIMMDGKSVF